MPNPKPGRQFVSGVARPRWGFKAVDPEPARTFMKESRKLESQPLGVGASTEVGVASNGSRDAGVMDDVERH